MTQESVLAYEAGFKAALLDHKLDVSGAAFLYDYTNKQISGRIVLTPNIFGALSTLVNVPKSRITGVEFQSTLRPVRGLSLTAAATYLDSKVVGDFINSDLLAVQQNFRGNPFPYTPKWQIVLDGEYRFPISPRLNGLIGTNVNYRNRTTAGFGASDLLRIAPYWLVDARVGIESPDGRWALQLFGRNITDQYYWTNVARAAENLRRFAGRPRTVGVQLSVRH